MKINSKYLLPVVALLVLTGCSAQPEGATTVTSGGKQVPATTADAKLKEGFNQKEFDINKVPADQRDRVKALMGSQGSQSKPGGSQTVPANPAPK